MSGASYKMMTRLLCEIPINNNIQLKEIVTFINMYISSMYKIFAKLQL